jgi:hypothetical protein
MEISSMRLTGRIVRQPTNYGKISFGGFQNPNLDS